MKNSATLTHNSGMKLSAQIIPNAISNAYLIKYINPSTNSIKCISTDGLTVKYAISCDELNDDQIFSIIFTGNKTNECIIQHYNSKKYLKYQNSSFSLEETTNYNPYQIFMMSWDLKKVVSQKQVFYFLY